MKSFLPRLLEFFMPEASDEEGQPLRTPDPFAPPMKHKTSTSAPGGIRVAPKPSDKTIDALTQPGVKRNVNPMAGKATGPKFKTPSSAPVTTISPKGPQGSQGTKGSGTTIGFTKPQYKGSYVGQTQTTNGQVAYKNVSWQKKGSDERGYGKVPSMQKVTVVWDGNDWISQDDFDRKARMGQLKK